MHKADKKLYKKKYKLGNEDYACAHSFTLRYDKSPGSFMKLFNFS